MASTPRTLREPRRRRINLGRRSAARSEGPPLDVHDTAEDAVEAPVDALDDAGGPAPSVQFETREQAQWDEDERGGDTVGLNRRAMQAAQTPAASLPDDWTPQTRMHDVQRRASGYEREYRLKLIHRMLMRNTPLDRIAQELGVTVRTIQNERRELHRRIREAAKKMDIHLLIGDTMAFYQEISGLAMRTATSANTPVNMRLAALRTSMTARSDLGRFLSTAGVFDNFNFADESEGAQEELVSVVTSIKDLLEEQNDLLPEALDGIPDSELFDEEGAGDPGDEEDVVLI